MTLNELLSHKPENCLSDTKWQTLKKSIIKSLLVVGDTTISELSNDLHSSIPTVTKAINELLSEGIVYEIGKVSNHGGRRPSLYSITPSCAFFLGVEMARSGMSIGLQNLKNEFISLKMEIPFILDDTEESLIELSKIINNFIIDNNINKSTIIGTCINLVGRVNSMEGFCQNYYSTETNSFSFIISKLISLPVYLENDTRAMALGEFRQGIVNQEKNVLFLNYSWGIGIGIITNGSLYYGKSGYSGEFGHSPIFDNGILCHCGKTGCLETEVSGWALVEQFKKALNENKKTLLNSKIDEATLHHFSIIAGALTKEDSLCIELITQQSEILGRYLSTLLNIFNPELLIVGGDFAELDDFVLLPMQAAIRKHTLGLVTNDMKLKKTILGNRAGIIGACQFVKEKMLATIE